uniref:UBX domain-containing protein 4 n=1 Tax=Anoplophora glabripennis TaxID=217634 RepID=V5GGA2_ANOGL
MKWFTGGIAEAVQSSKQKGAIFVVYVEGKDEQSKKITDIIENGDAGQNLGSENFVAIKIEADSLPHRQFIEIFNERRIPLIYFIGKNGTSLDAITGADDLGSLSTRIESVLQKAGYATVSSSPSASLIQNEQSTVAEDNVVCENGVCRIRTDSINASTSSEDKTVEDKVERAKELLQKKKEEKEREEKENERLKEIERRKMGQNVQQMKRWQEDQELKQLKEERDKEKREKQQARERVLAQIAQDKAERLAKSAPQSEPSRPQAVLSPSRPNDNSTRLQFKLPDGTTSMQEFANSDLLEAVVTHIKTNMNLPYSNFKLSTTFPRREFTENDYSQTLLDLQLCPTAVILVLPVNSGVVSRGQGGGTFNSLIWTLIAPLFHIFGMIKNFLFGAPTVVTKKTQTAEPTNQPENPRQRIRDSTVIKRQGNVHRLTDRRDSDDDSNTWNGNSTQQM